MSTADRACSRRSADCDAKRAEMPPPAPGWFSVTTGWSQILLSLSARMRDGGVVGAARRRVRRSMRTGLLG